MAINKKEIILSSNDTILTRASALFAAPEGSDRQQDLMRMWCADEEPQGKFILHTLAQQGLFDFEDHELAVQWQPPHNALKASFHPESVTVTRGVVLTMDHEKRICLYAHEGVTVLKLVRAIHRYATRMIRLDVR